MNVAFHFVREYLSPLTICFWRSDSRDGNTFARGFIRTSLRTRHCSPTLQKLFSVGAADQSDLRGCCDLWCVRV